MTDNYDDIINMPHHVSKFRQQMPMHKRAAQFAPFAAVSGYKELIEEATRRHIEKYEKLDRFEYDDDDD